MATCDVLLHTAVDYCNTTSDLWSLVFHFFALPTFREVLVFAHFESGGASFRFVEACRLNDWRDSLDTPL